MAAIAVAHGRGISAEDLAKALATFRSVKRRMDVKGEVRGVLVVDDFAHHPTAVRATIEAARARWPGRRLWAILEPRSNSMRRKVFEETLPVALALADRVVLAGVFRAQQLGDENRLEPEAVAESVRELGKSARVFPSADAIADRLAAEAEQGDVLLVMSNGSFDGLCEKLSEQARPSNSGFFRGKYQVKTKLSTGRASAWRQRFWCVRWAGRTLAERRSNTKSRLAIRSSTSSTSR